MDSTAAVFWSRATFPVARGVFLLATLLALSALCFALGGCADSEEEPTTSSDSMVEGDDSEGLIEARVGEPCEVTSDCKEGLACLGQEQLCVVLCDVGTEQCGEGISCQPAGDVGFCPPPAMPELGVGGG